MYSKQLANLACQASKNTYSPYSNFPVGAALITKDGKTYKGANIENASFGLTNCAERSCLFAAYSDGVRKDDIVAFCVYAPKEHLISPCGACRQVMAELLPTSCKIYMSYGKDLQIVETSLKELLPFSFSDGDMKND